MFGSIILLDSLGMTAMGWLDFLIIYLACGTPFAVYRIVLSESSAAETIVKSLKAALLWPLDGGKATLKRLRHASRSLSKPRLEIIRSQIEELLIEDVTHFRVFDFREVFDRYTGLVRIKYPAGQTTLTSLSEIADTRTTPTTEACLRRIERAKVERHAAAARDELIEYLRSSRSHRILSLAASLAGELSDDLLAAEISRHFPAIWHAGHPRVSGLSGSAS